MTLKIDFAPIFQMKRLRHRDGNLLEASLVVCYMISKLFIFLGPKFYLQEWTYGDDWKRRLVDESWYRRMASGAPSHLQTPQGLE